MALICVFSRECAERRYLLVTTTSLTESSPFRNGLCSLSAVRLNSEILPFSFFPLIKTAFRLFNFKMHRSHRRLLLVPGNGPALTAVHVKQRKQLIFKAARTPRARRAQIAHTSSVPVHSEEPNRQKVPCLINIPKAESQPLSAPSHPHANFFSFFFLFFWICTAALNAG